MFPHIPRIVTGMPGNRNHSYYTGWWFGTFFIFPCIGNVIIPTVTHSYFSEG